MNDVCKAAYIRHGNITNNFDYNNLFHIIILLINYHNRCQNIIPNRQQKEFRLQSETGCTVS